MRRQVRLARASLVDRITVSIVCVDVFFCLITIPKNKFLYIVNTYLNRSFFFLSLSLSLYFAVFVD
jgi:hypothetical protein